MCPHVQCDPPARAPPGPAIIYKFSVPVIYFIKLPYNKQPYTIIVHKYFYTDTVQEGAGGGAL